MPGDERRLTWANCQWSAFDRICPSDRAQALSRKVGDPALAALLADPDGGEGAERRRRPPPHHRPRRPRGDAVRRGRGRDGQDHGARRSDRRRSCAQALPTAPSRRSPSPRQLRPSCATASAPRSSESSPTAPHGDPGRRRCQAALGRVDEAPLTTLHGFANRLLASPRRRGRLPPGFEVLDDDRHGDRPRPSVGGLHRRLVTTPSSRRRSASRLRLGLTTEHLRLVAEELHRQLGPPGDRAPHPSRTPRPSTSARSSSPLRAATGRAGTGA